MKDSKDLKDLILDIKKIFVYSEINGGCCKKIRYLSPAQLRVLFLLAKSDKGIISSVPLAKKIGKEGKSLGAVFSSLVRHNFSSEPLIIPWGKDEKGRGLGFKLNTKLINKEKLLEVTKELLS